MLEAAIIGEHRTLAGQLQRALMVGNGRVASGIASQMRMGTGLRGASRMLRIAGKGFVVTNAGLVASDVYYGKAGKSKILIYGTAVGISVVSGGWGIVAGGAILGGELSGGIDPLTKDLDQVLGID